MSNNEMNYAVLRTRERFEDGYPLQTFVVALFHFESDAKKYAEHRNKIERRSNVWDYVPLENPESISVPKDFQPKRIPRSAVDPTVYDDEDDAPIGNDCYFDFVRAVETD